MSAVPTILERIGPSYPNETVFLMQISETIPKDDGETTSCKGLSELHVLLDGVHEGCLSWGHTWRGGQMVLHQANRARTDCAINYALNGSSCRCHGSIRNRESLDKRSKNKAGQSEVKPSRLGNALLSSPS